MQRESLSLINSFFRRSLNKGGLDNALINKLIMRQEATDLIITDKKYIFRDVSAINKFNSGGIISGFLNIDYKTEKDQLM